MRPIKWNLNSIWFRSFKLKNCSPRSINSWFILYLSKRNSFPAGLFIMIFGIKMHCTMCFGFKKNFPGIWVWSRWFSEYVYLYWRIVMHFESIGNKGIHFQIKWLHFRYSFYKIENEIVFFKFYEKVIKPKVFTWIGQENTLGYERLR